MIWLAIIQKSDRKSNFYFIYPSRRQNLPPTLKIFNFFPKFSIFFSNFQFFFQNFQKKSKFSEIFKISKLTIDFEYFRNIFRIIINNHTSTMSYSQIKYLSDLTFIVMPFLVYAPLSSSTLLG